MKSFWDWQDLGSALSLSNLWFIVVWRQLLYSNDNHYFEFEPRSILEYLAVLTDVLLLGAVFFILIKLLNSSSSLKGMLFRIIFLGLGLLSFGALGSEIIRWLSPETVSFVNLPLPILVLILCLLFSRSAKFSLPSVAENLKLLSLFFLPLCLVIFLQLLWVGFTINSKEVLLQSVERETVSDPAVQNKIVWVIFDELDYATLADAKQKGIDLSGFEQLMSQSFVAGNAFSPHGWTIKSIPALLTGKPFRTATPLKANDLLLYPLDDTGSYTLRQSDDIFTQLVNLGGNNAIVGWYNPYPRIFQEKISYGFWRSSKPPRCTGFWGFSACSTNIFLRSFLNIPFVARVFPGLWTANIAFTDDSQIIQEERHRFLTDKAEQLVTHPKINLLFFHFPIPHPPYIGRHGMHGKETYFDSLEVANDTIRKLREALEKAGQWDSTVIIISSDHWWRSKVAEDFQFLPEEQRQKVLTDTRIPFIVKLAGQQTRYDYESSFNTIITKELILEIFKEKIKNPEELARWLDDLRFMRPDLIELKPDTDNSPSIENKY